jgi:hypothetical protein
VSTRTPNNVGTYRVYGDAVPDILTSAQKHDLDPWVALALASSEGGFNYGSVGDGGTSYGPYQLHVGGALPPGETAAWANSPAGIDYAIQQIKSVVGNRTGAAGIAAGVTRFERPAEPTPEIQKDVSWLAAQLKKAGGRSPIADAKGYHPITSAQEALQGGLTDVVPGLDTLTKGIGSWVSGIEGFVLRGGKVILGVLLILAVMFLAIR